MYWTWYGTDVVMWHLSATSHSSFANASEFGPHPVVATTFSCLHLLLPSDVATTYPRGSFQCGSHCSTRTYIWNGRTSYIFPFIWKRRAITHHTPCNSTNLTYGIQCQPYQTIYRRNKATTLRSPQQTPQIRQLTSPSTYQNIFSLIITPLMTSHSFH